jgi:hypothetical protein
MRATKRFNEVFGVGIAAVLLGLGGAAGCSTPPPDANQTVVGDLAAAEPRDLPPVSLVDLPAALKASDPRLTPPDVQQLSARRGKDGKTILDVKYAPDERLKGRAQIPLLVGQLPKDPRVVPLLRDDGQGGDLRAGDGVFALEHDADFRDVLAEQNRMRDAALKLGHRTFPRFAGRRIVGSEKIERIPSDATIFPLFHSLPFFVDEERSLFVTAVPVVENPARTAHPCTGAGAGLGVWSLGHLMTEMAGADDPATFTESFFTLFDSPQTTANGLVAPARAAGVLGTWPRLPDGKLDLARAPFKLLAIVNRIDLAGNFSYGRVGGAELRFVFQAMNAASPTCAPLAGDDGFLMILEYGVPRTTCTSLRDWAQDWKALSAHTPGSSTYNALLEALTEEVVSAGAAPSKPRGSAINQVRTNQAEGVVERWVLREFRLTDAGFAASGVRQTPQVSFNGARFGAHASDLAAWINARQTAVLTNRHSVTDFFDPATPALAFLGAISQNRPVPKLDPGPAEEPLFLTSLWRATGIATSQLRHAFSLQTCDGCHGRETDTVFVHVGNATFGVQVGNEALLSGFLTGTTVSDPDDESLDHSFNDLQRRAALLQDFAEADCFFRGAEGAKGEFKVPLPPVATKPLLSTH